MNRLQSIKKASHLKLLFTTFAVACLLLLAACGNKPATENNDPVQGGASEPTKHTQTAPSPSPSPTPTPSANTNQKEGTNEEEKQPLQKELLGLEDESKHPVLTIEMNNGQTIKVELYPEIAPNTVNNMISLADKGFYDGLIFHRIIGNFMIQGGDPLGNGSGGPGYQIKGEFTSNKFENKLSHVRGVISMARAQDNDSAGSQFFITDADSPHLDKQYAAFGEVIEGMETVDAIVAADSEKDSVKRLEAITIKTMTVDKKGMDFPEPDVIELKQ